RTPRGPRTRTARRSLLRRDAAAWWPTRRTRNPDASRPVDRPACPCPHPMVPRARAGIRPARSGTESRARWSPAPAVPHSRSLHVLHLLAQALQFFLDHHHRVRDLDVVGLRADGIALAVHLLEQEVQLAPRELAAVHQRAELIEV